MSLLELKHIKKSFGSLHVLKDISMEVNEGEVVSIIGPSGSGKSTLLRCATMLETIDGGSLKYIDTVAAGYRKSKDIKLDEATETNINDEELKVVYLPNKELRKVKSTYGLVFQSFNLFPHYTVLKNVMDAPVSVQKRNKDEVEKEARALLEKVGLADKADYYPAQLSGGQKQRVAIARALAMKPKMLFFDEPTSALDPEITAEILKVMKQLADEKMTMIIVTHEIDFARKVSDRVIFMDGGVIVEEGSPAEVLDHPKMDRTREFLQKLEK